MLKKILLTLIVSLCIVAVGAGCDLVSPEPSSGQIKSDLIGETLTQATLTWHFHALSEFEEVTIVDTLREGNTIEYEVALELQDAFTGTHYTADILMIYQRSGTTWELFSVLTMSLQSTANGGDVEL